MSADRLELSIALSDNENTRPVLDGDISVESIRLLPTRVHPSEMFWRQLKFGDFDISEMSMSSLICATARAPTAWIAIPVFTSRSFYHTGIYVRTDRGIEQPADLRGKRIGVPEYQQTAAIWARGIIEHEFGVHAREMEWFMERSPEMSHGGSTGFRPPDGVKLSHVPKSTNLGEMLVSGEVDAVLHYVVSQNLVDRSTIDIAKDPHVKPMFPDVAAEKHRYFTKTGIFPINHTVVMRRALHERHPWIALNLFTGFLAAKAKVRQGGLDMLKPYFETATLGPDARRTLATDLMPFGVKACRAALETITRYVHEQGLTHRRVNLEEIFAPSTMDL
jgi:4,5-dihydroxyphthalate decarboxylase